MFDILGTLPSVNPRVQQPCLQFTYWSVVFMEQTMQGSQVFRDSSCYTTLREMRTPAYLCEMRVLAHFVCAFSRVDFTRVPLYTWRVISPSFLYFDSSSILFIYTKKKCYPANENQSSYFLSWYFVFSFHYR